MPSMGASSCAARMRRRYGSSSHLKLTSRRAFFDALGSCSAVSGVYDRFWAIEPPNRTAV